MTFPDIRANTTVRLMFGGTWVDVTADLMDDPITINRGRQDEQSAVSPSECSFRLDNRRGDYTPGRATSPYWPDIDVGVPVEITVLGYVRFVGEVASWEPSWPVGDTSGDDVDPNDLSNDDDQNRGESDVTVRCADVLRRLGQGNPRQSSAIFRFWSAFPELLGYFPFEDPEDTEGTAANAVPGPAATGLVYDDDNAPQFAADGSLGGSLPLPEWPVVGLTTWPAGGRVVNANPRWVMHVAVRIPAGAGEMELGNWLTSGGRYNNWTLMVDSSGQVQVRAFDPNASPTSQTYTTSTAGPIDDGVWRNVTVAVRNNTAGQQVVEIRVDGISQLFATSSTTVGRVRFVRPRPQYAVTTGKTPAGLGHWVVLDGGTDTGSLPSGLVEANPPLAASANEVAVARVVRLCGEQGVPLEIGGTPLLTDGFDVDEATGWGSAWTIHGGSSSDASISGGEGHLEPPGTTSTDDLFATRGSTTFVSGADILATVTAAIDGDEFTDASVFINFSDHGGGSYSYYEAAISTWDGGHVSLWRRTITPTPAYDKLVERSDVPILAGERYRIRVARLGGFLGMSVWPVGDPPPGDWTLFTTDTTEELTGGVIDAALGAFRHAGPCTVSFDDFRVDDLNLGVLLGPQRPVTFLEQLQDAADADYGILTGSRTQGGVAYRPGRSLIDQTAMLTLDAAANGGEIVQPFAPVLDDQALRNVVELQREDGSSVVVRDAASVARRGAYGTSVTLNLASDDQLLDHAGRLLLAGTWPGMRYPTVAPALNAVADLLDRYVAVDVGDRLDAIHLPPQHPLDAVEQLVQGYTETIAPDYWTAELNLSPYGPYVTGEYTFTGQNTLYLPGTSGAYASTPDAAPLDITGDLDVRVLAQSFDGWLPPADQTLMAKYQTAGDQRSWRLSLDADGGGDPALAGRPFLAWSPDGTITSLRTAFATEVVTPADNLGRAVVRATLDVDDGAGNHVVTFYTLSALDGSGVYEQLGEPVVGSGTTSIHAGTAELAVGAYSGGSAENFHGRVGQAILRDGIDGTIVADPFFIASPVADGQGNTWTAQGDAEISGEAPAADEPVRYSPYSSTTAAGLQLTDNTNADYASTPDDPSLDITGDIDIRVGALPIPNTWRVASGATGLARKYLTTGDQRSWSLWYDDDGLLDFRWSADGTVGAVLSRLSTEPVPQGTRAVRVTLDVDDGSSGHAARFYVATSISGPWSQLGDTVTNVGTTSIFGGSAPLEVGRTAPSGPGGTSFVGFVRAFELRAGIHGAVVANPDFVAASASPFDDAAGRTWTINGNARLFAPFDVGTDTELVVADQLEGTDLWSTRADTLPFDIVVSGARLRVIKISAATGPVQALTVQPAPINGVVKTIPVGSQVRLWQPARYGVW